MTFSPLAWSRLALHSWPVSFIVLGLSNLCAAQATWDSAVWDEAIWDQTVVTHTVTPSSTVGGTITPSVAQTVEDGETISFAIAADSGYQLSAVSGTCPGDLSGLTYLAGPISSDCTVVASLSPLPAGVPAIYLAESGDGEILLYVTAGSGGIPTSYSASCTDRTNTFTGSSTSSPITVSGLTNGVVYTCTVTATNSVGTSSASAATAPITPEEASTGLPIWLLYQATQ